MSNENDYEIKYVFGLLDLTNTQEIHVQQVNEIVQSLENLSPDRKRSKTMGAPIENNDSMKSKKPVKEFDKRISTLNVPGNPQKVMQNRGIKKSLNETINYNETNERNQKSQGVKHVQSNEKETNLLEVPEKEKTEQLKHFPNRKKTMNNEEFSELYQEIFHNEPINEEVLLKCFSIFDYEK